MNERVENCLYQSGLTAQGCWDELDTYTKDGIEKFAELIVQECAQLVQGVPTDSMGYHTADQKIKDHFGVA